MIDRKKVIKGLECCGYSRFMDKCQECPYDGKECFHRLKTDALALLKAQEPRLMTLDEAQTLRENDVVWLEDKGKPNIIPGIVRNRHLWPHSATMVTNFMRGDGCKVTAGDDDYGKRWRCWTSQPTDEQRAAEPWPKEEP